MTINIEKLKELQNKREELTRQMRNKDTEVKGLPYFEYGHAILLRDNNIELKQTLINSPEQDQEAFLDWMESRPK